MVQNSAGGFAFAVDDWTRLERFLILGNEGGSYYASERAMTVEAAACVTRCADLDADRTVRTIVDVSDNGRAPKNDPAVFALAMLAGHPKASALALKALPQVCRIGTHLFQFVECAQNFRGWGRALKRAVSQWYLDKDADSIAYQAVKYQQRNGWSHRDVLRLAKPRTDDSAKNAVFKWSVGKGASEAVPQIISAFEQTKSADEAALCRLIREFNLPRECVPTDKLNSVKVWDALLDRMPMTAMVRNLGKMSEVGLLKPMSKACQTVVARLADEESIRKSRLHPISLLVALSVYKAGRGMRGSLTWDSDSGIIDALDNAFYLAFGNVERTGKRFLLGLDVSGSMTGGYVAGSFLTPRVASGAMAMVTVRSETTHTVAFTGGLSPTRNSVYGRSAGLSVLGLSARQRLDDVVQSISNLPFGPTDCALPMLYAAENRIEADVFVIYTDSETWCGGIHPTQALQQYRQKMGIPAKLIVCGMVSNQFTIADPSDAGMLDVVGFDTSAPAVMSEFVKAN